MSTITVTVGIRFAWWVMPYVRLLKTIHALTGVRFDEDKTLRFLERGFMSYVRHT